MSHPNRIIIDFLLGVAERKDAENYARGFIEAHFESPAASTYFVQKFNGGYAYEVQEGGSGQAYLPNVLKALEEDGTVAVCIASGSRILQITTSPNGGYSAILLPEETPPTVPNPVEVDPGPKMKLYKTSGASILVIGAAVALLGTIALLVSLVVKFMSADLMMPPKAAMLPAASMPVMQWQYATEVARVKPNNFIVAMRFDGTAWVFDLQDANLQPSGSVTIDEIKAALAAAAPPPAETPPPQ